ncbi:MAG: hypothetical protein AAGM33_08160 [Pseudomonadota bacterium]
MKRMILIAAMMLVTSCSETPIEEQGEEAIAEMEKQIEEDARSLEAAAAEAVTILEEDIAEELEADGIGAPDEAPTEASENQPAG